jgi:hypothetical protein
VVLHHPALRAIGQEIGLLKGKQWLLKIVDVNLSILIEKIIYKSEGKDITSTP